MGSPTGFRVAGSGQLINQCTDAYGASHTLLLHRNNKVATDQAFWCGLGRIVRPSFGSVIGSAVVGPTTTIRQDHLA